MATSRFEGQCEFKALVCEDIMKHLCRAGQPLILESIKLDLSACLNRHLLIHNHLMISNPTLVFRKKNQLPLKKQARTKYFDLFFGR